MDLIQIVLLEPTGQSSKLKSGGAGRLMLPPSFATYDC